MLRVLVRRSRDISYLVDDPALELDGVREGPAQRWWRGEGDGPARSDVASVLRTSERARVVGYDVIVAAPRPISILVALDPVNAPSVVVAHRRAVDDALTYLEQRALVVRDRREGEDRDLPGRWSRVVAFTHGVNRHGEPHLHDHVLVGAQPDGARGVLDSRALFAHVATADALYRSSLRAGVAHSTPYLAWRSFEGVEHVSDQDEGYRVLWGGHHAERGEKQHWSRDDAVRAWRRDLERFDEHGVVATPGANPRRLDEHGFAASFEGRADVARRHLVLAWANAAIFGSAAHDVIDTIDLLYPGLTSARGIHEACISVREARMIAMSREHGPRPLRVGEIDDWRQRSRDTSREMSRDAPGRSR